MIRRFWVSVGVALLALIVLEGATRAGIVLRKHLRPSVHLAAMEERLRDGAPPGPHWGAEYLREFGQVNQSDGEEWHPYVYWRPKPYRGKYINIDQAGLRRTWNSTSSPSPNQLNIFAFGGSTMWGTFARDEFTIPSLLSKKLAGRLASGVFVTNFGEIGYVSTQEVIALMLELRKGNVPDVVVFYDGVNDTFSAFQSGVAGIPQSEDHRAAEFNLRERLNWREGFVEQLALYRLSQWAVGVVGGPALRRPSRQPVRLDESLANAVVGAYLQNVRIVNSLAARFGFQAVFFWQPTIFSKQRASQDEKQMSAQFESSFNGAVPFFERVYGLFRGRVNSEKIDGVYDLSSIFDDEDRPMFVDHIHVSEAGNNKIAEAMERIVREVVPAKR